MYQQSLQISEYMLVFIIDKVNKIYSVEKYPGAELCKKKGAPRQCIFTQIDQSTSLKLKLMNQLTLILHGFINILSRCIYLTQKFLKTLFFSKFYFLCILSVIVIHINKI